MHFTVDKVRELPVQGTVKFYTDPDNTGFSVKVTPTGKRSYMYIFKYNGQKTYVRIGTCEEYTPYQALSLYRKLKKKKEAGIDIRMGAQNQAPPKPLERRRAIGSRDPLITIAELFRDFEKLYMEQRIQPRTKKNYISIYTAHIEPRFGQHIVELIDYDEMLDYFEEISRESGPYAGNRMLALLNKLFTFARKRRIIPMDCNPTYGIERNIESPRLVVIPDAEMGQIYRELVDSPLTSEVKAILQLMFLTGQRHHSLRHLSMEDINTGDMTIKLTNKARRGAQKPHNVPFVGRARQLVEGSNRFGMHGYLFCNPKTGKPVVGTTVSQSFKSLPTAKGYRPHDIRRTVATIMQREGNYLEHIKAVLGHTSSSVTTTHYALYDLAREKRELLEWWNDYFHKEILG